MRIRQFWMCVADVCRVAAERIATARPMAGIFEEAHAVTDTRTAAVQSLICNAIADPLARVTIPPSGAVAQPPLVAARARAAAAPAWAVAAARVQALAA